MTTSSTRDVAGTVEQIIKLHDYGCEIARVTVQGMKEAESCELIKNFLVQKGLDIPLVADIHFYPPAAMRVADFVEKVRINPGNFLDKRAIFQKLEFTDEGYADELLRIEEQLEAFVKKCQRLNRAVRIGTNHGSLSDRIMSRYGDTPEGMVESAVEFTKAFRKFDFHDIIFSMKASNPFIMVRAYRLLVARMIEMGWDYPLHLGVTEAGPAEDGRLKSAMGIGALLLDGIGDTIRVSLTEDPWYEIEPCKKLKTVFDQQIGKGEIEFTESTRKWFTVPRKKDLQIKSITIAPNSKGILGVTLFDGEDQDIKLLTKLGLQWKDNAWNRTLLSVDFVQWSGKGPFNPEAAKTLLSLGITILESSSRHMLKTSSKVEISDLDFIILSAEEDPVHEIRKFYDDLQEQNSQPAIIFSYNPPWKDQENFLIDWGAHLGALFVDGIGEGVLVSEKMLKVEERTDYGLRLLQSARLRMSKADYVACPGCGRTLFALQPVTERIKQATEHLKGVTIAVMGCIVNGPGEMADSDFGYVGSKTGMIDLYVGKTCVQKNIPEEHAVEHLVDLIKKHGKWCEK